MKFYQRMHFFIFISIIGHIVLFLLLISWLWVYPEKKSSFGAPKIKIISSYLLQNETLQQQKQQTVTKDTVKSNAHSSHQEHPILQKHIIKKSTQTDIKKLASAKNKTSPLTTKSSVAAGQAIPELIALLHAAIQKEQHYPPNALEMEREGRITLKFILYTNGTIAALHIVKSSGESDLDAAALAAVTNAAPFQHIDKFLQRPQEYQIDVVFALS